MAEADTAQLGMARSEVVQEWPALGSLEGRVEVAERALHSFAVCRLAVVALPRVLIQDARVRVLLSLTKCREDLRDVWLSHGAP